MQGQARESLTDHIYQVLKKEITVCKIAPGTRLVEGDLAARFATSKTPVREALARLRQDRLLDVMPRIGYIVTPLSMADMHEVFALRALLEVEAVGLATQRMDDGDLDKLMQQAQRGAAMGPGPFDADGLLTALDYNRDFHTTVARCSGNQRLADLVHRLTDETSRLLFIDRSLHPEGYLQFPDHIALVGAMQRRDVDAARQTMAAHIEFARKRIIELILSSQTGIPLRANSDGG